MTDRCVVFVMAQHMVEWSKFEDALASDLGRPLHDAEQRHLREALDASDSGHISAHKFGAFLQGFGPGVRDSVEQVAYSLLSCAVGLPDAALCAVRVMPSFLMHWTTRGSTGLCRTTKA